MVVQIPRKPEICTTIFYVYSPSVRADAYLLKYFSGFTALPFFSTSKCRCGPVEMPVFPDLAIVCPLNTRCPLLTSDLLRCWYLVVSPLACLTSTYLPLAAGTADCGDHAVCGADDSGAG